MVPSLRVENCDLHGNSIVPMSKSVPPGCEYDRVTVQIAVFDTQQGTEGPPLADCNVQIEELELSVRNVSRASQLAVVPYMEVGST